METSAERYNGTHVCSILDCRNRLETSYYRKYKICEEHAKSQAVTIEGLAVRFCQKCGRFQDLTAFDGLRRSCRQSLESHNKRRRAKHAHSSRDKAWRRARKETAANSKASGETSKKRSKLPPGGSAGEEGALAAFKDVGKCMEELEEAFGHPIMEDGQEVFHPLGPLERKPEYREEYQTEYSEHTMSLKFHGSPPSDLPKDILADVQLNVPVNPTTAFFEGAMRPGCTHVSLRMRVEEGKDADELRSLATEKLAAGLAKLWRCDEGVLSRGIEVQMGGSVTHVGGDGSSFTVRSLPEMSVFPPVVESGIPAEFEIIVEDIDLYGRTIAAFCRQNGKYLTASIVHEEHEGDEVHDDPSDSDCIVEDDADIISEARSSMSLEDEIDLRLEEETALSIGAESSRSVSGRNSIGSVDTMDRNGSEFVGECRKRVRVLGLLPGSCEIELMVDNVLTAPVSVLVLPSSEHVIDARRLLDGMGKAQAVGFIRDAGMVVRHVYSPQSLLPSDLPMVQRLAVKTCDWAMESRSSHLVRILQEALPPENVCCSGARDPVSGTMSRENTHEEMAFEHAGQSKPKDKLPTELDMEYSTGMGMMPSKIYESYELETERAIIQKLCLEVSRLSVQDKMALEALQHANGWRNVAMQLIFGLGLIILASSSQV